MASLKQELKEEIYSSSSVGNFCLNPNPESCSGTISSNLATVNVPALGKDHELKISDGFKPSSKNICEKCIWVRKSI